jgi:uncharacterized protein involved in exopolysaccharide biosynthesis
LIPTERNEPVGDDEIDYVAVWQTLWNSKFLIFSISFLGALIATYLALTAIPTFKAEVVIAEVHDTSLGGAASQLTSQLGGLASLAGINLRGAAGTGHEAQAILESRHLEQMFIQNQGLLPELLPDAKNPTLWKAVKKFREGILAIRADKVSGLTTVTINWKDPVTAARWANQFVALANETMRTRALDDSSRNIAYLNKQVAQTNVVDMQRALYNLIESETKTLMLANARTEYAFTIVDPAVPAELKSCPHRAIMIIVGTLLGLMVGLGTVFIRSRIRQFRVQLNAKSKMAG